MLVTGLQVTVGTGSPTAGVYRFSGGAFWVLDIYFLVVVKTFLVVYSMEVLIKAVLMDLGLSYRFSLRERLYRTWWAAGGPCLASYSQGLLGGESSSWLISRACRHPSGLLVVGDGSVCGVGAGGHPKRAQSWALSSHLAGMPLLTTRCSHHVVSLDRFGLALPVLAIADKGGWASTDL